MTNEWSLREEMLLTTHRWPLIVLFCLAGGLLGFTFALNQPSPYRATKELYVGLNIYRAPQDSNASEHAGLKFYNIDDYKNWQMANLNSLIFMDKIITETLIRLRAQDDYWFTVSQGEFVKMLHAYWRNAGKWRLVAENENLLHASQAVTTWEGVVIEHVYVALHESRNIMTLNKQLDSFALAQTQAVSRIAELSQIRDSLQSLQTKLSQLPVDNRIKGSDRWLIWNSLNRLDLDPSWEPFLIAFPTLEASSAEYLDWLGDAMLMLDQEIHVLQAQITAIEGEKEEISVHYEDSFQKSLGLSPDLLVDKITDAQPDQTIVRPIGLLVLVGASLGFITWMVLWLARISLRRSQ